MHIEQVNDGPVTLCIDSIKDPKLQQKWEKEQARLQKQKAKQTEVAKIEEAKTEEKQEEEKQTN